MEYPNKSQLYKRLTTVAREQELLATEVATLSGQWTGGANYNPNVQPENRSGVISFIDEILRNKKND